MSTATAPTASRPHTSNFTGTGSLVRFMLRRDRVKLPAWTGGLGLFVLYLHTALPSIAETEADLVSATALFSDPVGRMVIGPGYGFDAPTYERFVANGYGLYFLILTALMSILLIVRHTRVEEQTGRAELIRANVVGRRAPLTAAIIVAILTNLVAAIVILAAMAGVAGFAVTGSVLFAAGIGIVGIVFAGVATITVQLTEYSRAAAGMAGAVLGASFVIRGGGDMVQAGGSALSWFAPLAWAQQTAPFVLDRWWPLGIALLSAAMTIAVGFALTNRRDLGASRLSVRPGKPEAAAWLGTPVGMAFRLQRAGIIGWSLALAVAGVAFGSFADAMLSAGADLPEAFQDLFDPDDLLGGYIAYMAVYMAFFVGVYVIMAVQGLRGEETTGRLEPVLATAVGRGRWLATNLLVTACASVFMMVLVGITTGIGVALVSSEPVSLWEVTLSHANHTPALLVVLGTAALLFGLTPRAVPAAWILVGYGLFIGTFGQLMEVPAVLLNISPFAHLADMPLEPFAATPFVVLLVLSGVLGVVGVLAFRRRDITAT